MEEGKISRRQFLIATAAVAGTGILAACAGPTAPVSEAPSPTPEEGLPETGGLRVFTELEPPPDAPPFEGGPQWQPADLTGKNMILWGLEYDPHIERYEILADTFQKRTGAAVEIQPQAWPIDEKLMTAMAAGTPPDAVCWMGFLSEPVIRQRAIAPIDDLVFKPLGIDMDKWWFPGAIGPYSYEGNVYGVPVENEWDGYTVTGRLDLIEEAGAEAEALWPGTLGEEGLGFESYDDLFALAETLQQTDDQGNVTIWGLNSSGWEMWSLLGMMRSMGTLWWDPDNQQFNMDSEAAVEAIRLLVEIPFERGIEGILGMSHINAFVAGQVALGRGNATTAGEAWKLDIHGENVIVPPPIAGTTPLFMGSGGWGFELPSQAKNQDVGVEFLKFMCTYEAQYIFSQIYGASPPATRGLIGSDIYAGDHPVKRGLRRQLKALENYIFWGFGYGNNSEVSDIILGNLGLVREGKITAQEAAQMSQESLAEQYRQHLSEL